MTESQAVVMVMTVIVVSLTIIVTPGNVRFKLQVGVTQNAWCEIGFASHSIFLLVVRFNTCLLRKTYDNSAVL